MRIALTSSLALAFTIAFSVLIGAIHTAEKPQAASPSQDEPSALRVKVRGRVYDVAGKPAAGARLYFQRNGYRYGNEREAMIPEEYKLATVVTAADGRYEVNLPSDEDCYVSRDGDWRLLGVTQQMIRTKSGKAQTLDFGGPTKATGRLIVNGHPLANATVKLSGESPDYGPLRACARTDSDGSFVFRGIPAGRRTLYFLVMDAKGEWVDHVVKAKTVDIPAAGADLGVIESTTVKLVVRCPALDADRLAQAKVTLEEYDERSTAIGDDSALPHANPGDPLVFGRVIPGRYELVYRKPMKPQEPLVRKVVEVTSAPEQFVDLELPEGNASLSGTYNGPPDWCRLWSKDQRVMAHVILGKGRFYHVDNLPAGEYFFTRQRRRDPDVLLTVTLAENEKKVLDLTAAELADKPKRPTGYRHLMIYTSDGVLLPGCDVKFPGAERPPEAIASRDGRLDFIGEPGTKLEATISYPGFKSVRQPLELSPAAKWFGVPVRWEATDVPPELLTRVFLEPM